MCIVYRLLILIQNTNPELGSGCQCKMYGVLFSGDSHVSRANIPWFLKWYRIHSCAFIWSAFPSVPQHFLNDNNSNFANDTTWNYSTFLLVILTESIWFLPSFSVVNLASTVIDRLVSSEIVRGVNLQQEMLEWAWYVRRSFFGSNHSKAAEHGISWQFRPGSICNNCCRLAWTSDTVNTKATTTLTFSYIEDSKLFMNVIRRQLRLVLIMIIQCI